MVLSLRLLLLVTLEDKGLHSDIHNMKIRMISKPK